MDAKQRDRLVQAFPVIKPNTPANPAPAPVQQQSQPQKPTRTIGNIYSAVQAQSIYNPGQPTPPDPSGSSGPTAPGPGIGSNPQNQTIKNPPAKQLDLGTAGNLQPKENSGWGRTTDG